MAKSKKAKSKATKTAKRAAGPCQSLRDLLDLNQQQIADIEDSLSDPDIPESIKKHLRVLLARLKAVRARLQAELKKCEARSG